MVPVPISAGHRTFDILTIMNYVYHRVTQNMTGTILYPLNKLKEINPDAFNEHVKKYEERQHLLNTKIPILNCVWNDVLHFTAVHPTVLYKNIAHAGFDADELVWKEWFEIPVDMLDEQNTVSCLYRRDVSVIPRARDFQRFDPNKMDLYATVPQETLDYYKKQKAKGERPLFFHRVPHILFKGIIETKNLKRIIL